MQVMEELYRISKPGAVLVFRVPHHASGNWPIDFTHCNQFSIRSLAIFDMYDENNSMHPWRNKGKFKLKLIYWKLEFHPWVLKPMEWFVKLFPGFYDYHLCYLIQPNDLVFKYKVIK